MRNLIFLICLLCLPLLSPAQNEASVEIDERLYDVHEPSYLDYLKEANPFLLKRWAFYLDNAFFITKDPEKKPVIDYPIIKIDNLKEFNILKLEKEQSLNRDWDKRMMYKIEGTKKILVFYSGKEFNSKLNAFLGRKHK